MKLKKPVSSISHNQGHEIIRQIEDALKKTGMDPLVDVSALIKDNFFYNKVGNFFKKDEQFFSSMFAKKHSLKIAKSPDEFTICYESVRLFFKSANDRELERGKGKLFINGNVSCNFKDKTVPGIDEDFETFRYDLLKKVTLKELLKEAENVDIYRRYDWLQALSIIRAAILAGDLDKEESIAVVPFIIPYSNYTRRFLAVREYGGKLSVSEDVLVVDKTMDEDGGGVYFKG